jgi:hypothetical protein
MLENMTPGAAIAIVGFFAVPIAFMGSTTMIPGWFFGLSDVTMLHKLLLYVIGFSWAWVALRSLALASYLLVSGKFVVVAVVSLPIILIGSWILPQVTSKNWRANTCTLESTLAPEFIWVKDVGKQCDPRETSVGADVSGTWVGTLSCHRASYPVRLALSSAMDGSVSGKFELSDGGRLSTYHVLGKVLHDNVSLKADKQISGAKGLPVLDVTAMYSSPLTRRMYGKTYPQGCFDFNVKEVQPDVAKFFFGDDAALKPQSQVPQANAVPEGTVTQRPKQAPAVAAATANSGESTQPMEAGRFRVADRPVTMDADLQAVCRSEIGEGFRVADWNDIRKMLRSGYLPDDILTQGDAWVAKDGQMFFGSRHYLVTRANHKRAPGYLAHDTIDNALFDLGSWTTPNPVLCIKGV